MGNTLHELQNEKNLENVTTARGLNLKHKLARAIAPLIFQLLRLT